MARKAPRRTGPTWEVDLLPAPVTLSGPQAVYGMLLVVETSSGGARLVDLLTDARELTGALQRAATAPVAPCRPGAPARILCRAPHRALVARSASLLGARIEVAAELPGCDALAASMRTFLQGPDTLPAEPEAWAAVAAALWRAAPWSVLPDSVQIRFTGGPDPVRGRVAIVLGLAGEQHGLTIFESQDDYERFLDWLYEEASGDWTYTCVHFDRIEELPPDLVRRARDMGLVHGAYALQLYGGTGATHHAVDQEQQRACLAMTQAVLAAWQDHGARLEAGERGVAQTVLGPVRYSTVDPDAAAPLGEPLLWPCDHQVHLGRASTGGPLRNTLIFKAAAADARGLAGRLRGVDALSVEGAGEAVDYVAWCGDRRLGVVARAPRPDAWEDEPTVLLVVSGGGAQRTNLDPRRFVLVEELALRGAGPSATAAAFPPPDDIRADSWDGPVETWPKASSVLLEFAAPMGLQELPSALLPKMIDVACLVWNAVVLADAHGEPGHLDQARRAIAVMAEGRAMVELLVDRKRALYPRDVRLLAVQECRRTSTEIQLRVASRLR